MSMHNTYTQILSGIQKFFKEMPEKRAVLGVSGGIDSTVCLKLMVDALGSENVTAIIMPEKGISNEENTSHAKALCSFFGVETYLVPINSFIIEFMPLPWKPSELALINTKSRLRTNILYNFANTRNGIVIGTANKTDLSLGYGAKHGDLAADIFIIGDLFKDEVQKLAEHLELPDELLTKTPSGELYKGQTDENELGGTLKEIDSILKQTEEGISKEELLSKGINPNTVHKTLRLKKENSHKLEKIPVILAH